MLIVAATQRTALRTDLHPGGLDQGNEMIAIVLVVCTGVALSRGLRAPSATGSCLSRSSVGGPPAVDSPSSWSSRSPQRPLSTCLENCPSWEAETQPARPAIRRTLRESNGRHQYWSAALDAAENPLTGIGPGTWEFYWAREGSLPGFVRDAHSLFFEALGESGVPGLLLISGFIFGVIGFGIRRAFAAPLDTRPWIAAATAACIAFATAAAVDWAWEMALIPIVFLLLVAAILAVRDPQGGRIAERPRAADPNCSRRFGSVGARRHRHPAHRHRGGSREPGRRERG